MVNMQPRVLSRKKGSITTCILPIYRRITIANSDTKENHIESINKQTQVNNCNWRPTHGDLES